MRPLIPGDGAVAYGATCDVERAVTTHLSRGAAGTGEGVRDPCGAGEA